MTKELRCASRVRGVGAAALVCFSVLLAAAQVHAQADDQLLCPLSEEQQQESQNAWATVAEAFKHDRCSNCHGKVNPFGESTHPGQQDLELDETGRQNDELTFAACKTCHETREWKTPPSDLLWWNQSVEQLCRTQHEKRQPFGFRKHSELDTLIIEAFLGTFAFTENLREDPAPWPDPPPLNQPEFLRRIDAWYAAQGIDAEDFSAKWRGDQLDCGCVPQAYEIALDAVDTYSGIPFCSGNWRITETVPITFTADKSYTGTGDGTATIPNFSCNFPGLSCTYEFRPAATTVQLVGDVVEENGVPKELTVTGSRTTEATSVVIDCTCEDPSDCPFPITIGVPEITAPFEVDPALDARLGTYVRPGANASATITYTVRKRD